MATDFKRGNRVRLTESGLTKVVAPMVARNMVGTVIDFTLKGRVVVQWDDAKGAAPSYLPEDVERVEE